MKTKTWQQYAFLTTMIGCIQFVLLTSIAMLIYPGGTRADPTTSGYSFFNNFFSDLGLVVSLSGQANTGAFILFTLALTLAGLGLILFFLAAPVLFRNRPTKLFSIFGSIVGVFSGLAYIGIAYTPADLNLEWHQIYVPLAFGTFLVVVVLYTLAIFLETNYPNRYAFVYLVFALLLAAYMWLLLAGPQDMHTQATGQKIIVYAQIICMFIQTYGAWRIEGTRLSGITP